MSYDYELLPSHPHAGKRVKLVEGSAPDTVQGVKLPSIPFMALVEDEEGKRYYASRSDLGIVTVTPLAPPQKTQRR